MDAIGENLDAPEGTLYLSTGLVLFVGRHLNSAMHRHLGASITISLGRPIRFREQGAWREALGCIAHGNANFELRCGAELCINVQLDPEKSDGYQLRARRDTQEQVRALEGELAQELQHDLRALLDERASGRRLQQRILAAVLPGPLPRPCFDVRVARVLARLKDCMPQAPSASQLAVEVGLSEGRLIHLFGEQLGVPLRRYVLALRVRYLLFFLAAGQNLTDAAHAAGFSDSAHFARVYREMYGMPPSKVLRASKVSVCFEAPELTPEDPHYRSDKEHLSRLALLGPS